jgi:hypothetical protein
MEFDDEGQTRPTSLRFVKTRALRKRAPKYIAPHGMSKMRTTRFAKCKGLTGWGGLAKPNIFEIRGVTA